MMNLFNKINNYNKKKTEKKKWKMGIKIIYLEWKK